MMAKLISDIQRYNVLRLELRLPIEKFNLNTTRSWISYSESHKNITIHDLKIQDCSRQTVVKTVKYTVQQKCTRGTSNGKLSLSLSDNLNRLLCCPLYLSNQEHAKRVKFMVVWRVTHT